MSQATRRLNTLVPASAMTSNTSQTSYYGSAFAEVPVAPPDAIFGVKNAYMRDTHPDKLNLSVGAYRTDEGKPLVLNIVRKVEREIAHDSSMNKEYLPIHGNAKYIAEAQRLILGDNSPSIREGRVTGVQALSGTGALRLCSEFIREHLPKGTTIYMSNPTWGNHKKIFKHARVPFKKYRYFSPKTLGLDIDGMLEDLRQAPPRSVILLHACAHNPTGVDPTKDQWQQIADVMEERGHTAFFDSAYQGYATGDLALDAYAVRLFDKLGREFFIAQSFSKNLGLYGERAGCASIVTKSGESAKASFTQLKAIVRPMYSNPPRHGAEIALRVLSNPRNFAAWQKELSGMSNRIIEMRTQLLSELKRLGTPGDWQHIVNQIGMFSYTGISPKQVKYLRDKYHIYMLSSGRASMACLSRRTTPYFAKALDDAVRNVH